MSNINPNLPAPGQQSFEFPGDNETPTQILQPLGNVAVKAESIPDVVDATGRSANVIGDQVVMRVKRGERPGGTPIWQNVAVTASPDQAQAMQTHRQAEAAATSFDEPEPTRVIQPPKVEKPAEAAPAAAPVVQPAKPKTYYSLTPPQPDEFAGLSTEAKMALVDKRAAELNQIDTGTTKVTNVDSLIRAADAERAAEAKPAAQQPRRRPTAREAEPVDENLDAFIPRAAQPDDVRFADPRLDRRRRD